MVRYDGLLNTFHSLYFSCLTHPTGLFLQILLFPIPYSLFPIPYFNNLSGVIGKSLIRLPVA